MTSLLLALSIELLVILGSYFVLRDAAQQTGNLQGLGQVIGYFVMSVSVIAILATAFQLLSSPGREGRGRYARQNYAQEPPVLGNQGLGYYPNPDYYPYPQNYQQPYYDPNAQGYDPNQYQNQYPHQYPSQPDYNTNYPSDNSYYGQDYAPQGPYQAPPGNDQGTNL